ncbi:MAG TPA: hypothetical protein VGE07_10800 [Herpetosiphonaceae bacterium]
MRPLTRVRLACVALVIGLGVWCAPTGLYIYHIERAGALMERGLSRPAADQIDALPVARDLAALAEARGHLARALALKPDDAHAYRMLGQIEAAEGAWRAAAETFDRARALSAEDPLIRWEAALVESRLWQDSSQARQTPFVPPLDSRFIHAPPQPIATPYCQAGQPERCYLALTEASLPLAVAPSQSISATALFLHPPAGLTFTLPVTREQTALVFLLGLVPAARQWNTDGVTYEILAGDGTQPGRVIYARTLDAATLAKGWTPDWVDVSAWAGRPAQLTLRVDAGPQHDPANDWALWGGFLLADAAQAPLIARHSRLRMQHEFARAGYAGESFGRRADTWFRQGAWDKAYGLYQQALRLPDLPPDAQFRAVLAGAIVNHLPRDLQIQLGVPVHAITATSLIEGEGLRWLDEGDAAGLDGTPLEPAFPAGAAAGTLRPGGAATAIIEVAEGGAYQLTVRAASRPGAAGELALEHNGRILAPFATAADGAFRDYQYRFDLAPGTHVLGVRFAGTGGGDAFIDWLRVAR